MKKAAIFLILLAAAAGGGWYWRQHSGQETRSSEARLEARLASISPPFSGMVAEVMVAEGDAVNQGQVLYRLDSAGLQEKLAAEEDLLARIGQSLPADYTDPEKARQSAEEMQALLPLARRQEADAKQEMESLSDAKAQAAFALATLRARGESDGQALQSATQANDAATANFIRAKEQFEQASLARAALESAAAKNPTREDAATQGRIMLYEAQRERTAYLRDAIDATFVKAPGPGLVSRMNVEAGSPALPGENIIVFMPFTPEGMWVTAFFLPGQEKAMRPGQSCRIEFEGIPGAAQGKIEAVFPRQIPPHIGKDRIPVRIALTTVAKDGIEAFKPGLAATVVMEGTASTPGGDNAAPESEERTQPGAGPSRAAPSANKAG